MAATDEFSRGSDRHAQLLRGTLDMCLLALLAHEPAHGYELVRRLDAAGLSDVGYGTVYPLLTRMRRLGMVTDRLVESPAGPARKIYSLTDEGHRRLAGWISQWRAFVATVDGTISDLAPVTPDAER